MSSSRSKYMLPLPRLHANVCANVCKNNPRTGSDAGPDDGERLVGQGLEHSSKVHQDSYCCLICYLFII
jgi:hypothetical protein